MKRKKAGHRPSFQDVTSLFSLVSHWLRFPYWNIFILRKLWKSSVFLDVHEPRYKLAYVWGFYFYRRRQTRNFDDSIMISVLIKPAFRHIWVQPPNACFKAGGPWCSLPISSIHSHSILPNPFLYCRIVNIYFNCMF